MSEAVDEKGVGPSSPDSPTRAPGTESRARSRSRSRSRERATPTDGGAVAANAPSAVIGQVKPGAGYLCAARRARKKWCRNACVRERERESE